MTQFSHYLWHQLRLFFTALQFFTRIPIPRWVGFDPSWLSPSLRYFPLVGWLIGAITAAVYLLAQLCWSSAVAVVLSTIAGIWSTGAFHEDGFADVCDGFGGGMTPERVLEIMRDSRVGAYGAIGISLLLLLKCTVLAGLPNMLTAMALLLAHPLSRLASGAVIWGMDYVREDGKAKVIATQLSTAELIVAGSSVFVPLGLLFCLALAFVRLPCTLLGLMTATLAGMVLIGLMVWRLVCLFQRRIGGYTGDCLGTVQQLSEVMFYLGFSGALCLFT